MSLKHIILQTPMKTSLVLWISFCFCYYWACLGFNVSLVSGCSVHCLDQQKLLLLQLEKTLKFNSTDSNKLVFWNESIPCSQWRSVTWDEEGHVAGLDLSMESISGGLDNSSTLFSLQYLKHLNLAFNCFGSVIPSRIKDLKSLTSLNLSNAGFVEQIPMEIAQLTRLAILDLSSNYLEGPIPQFIFHLRRIKVLQLSSNRFNGTLCLDMFERLQNLSVLDLHDNYLQGTLPTFPSFASYLDYSFNNFSSVIPTHIGNHLSSTIFLSFSHKALYDPCFHLQCFKSSSA